MPEIPKIKKGGIITAKRLNDYGDGINELNKFNIQNPRQLDDRVDGLVQQQASEDEANVAGVNDYTETSRSTSTVLVYDTSFTNYAEIQRIESITFANSLGETLKLTFTGNPIPPTPP